MLSWADLERICNLDQPEPEPPEEVDDMAPIIIHDTVLNAAFLADGTPVSPEMLAALKARGWTEVFQDHPEWRQSAMHRTGSGASLLYGQRVT